MCNICKHKYGSVKHQLYWFVYFFIRFDFKKAFTSLYHLINKKTYRKWFNKYHETKMVTIAISMAKSAPTDCDIAADYFVYLGNLEPLDFYNEVVMEN